MCSSKFQCGNYLDQKHRLVAVWPYSSMVKEGEGSVCQFARRLVATPSFLPNAIRKFPAVQPVADLPIKAR